MRIEVMNTRQALAEQELATLIGRLADEAGIAIEPFSLPRGAKDNRLKALFQTEYLVSVLHAVLGDAPESDPTPEPAENEESDAGDANGELADDSPESSLSSPDDMPVSSLRVPPGVKSALKAAGYATVSDVRNASDDDLLMVRGVGAVMIERIRQEIEDVAT